MRANGVSPTSTILPAYMSPQIRASTGITSPRQGDPHGLMREMTADHTRQRGVSTTRRFPYVLVVPISAANSEPRRSDKVILAMISHTFVSIQTVSVISERVAAPSLVAPIIITMAIKRRVEITTNIDGMAGLMVHMDITDDSPPIGRSIPVWLQSSLSQTHLNPSCRIFQYLVTPMLRPSVRYTQRSQMMVTHPLGLIHRAHLN